MNYNEENDLFETERLSFEIEPDVSGLRLDKVLAQLIPTVSRSRITSWITQGAVKVNQEVVTKASKTLKGHETVEVDAPPSPETLAFAPADIDFEVVCETPDFIVVNKPAGLVTHPAAGHWNDTLLNGLLARYPELALLPRAGIVHRLDKDTTGLMVVARTVEAQTSLVHQLSERTVHRQYLAVVYGTPPESLTIENYLFRDPAHPLRFAVSRKNVGRYAKTTVKRVSSVGAFSLVACQLATGRTHQIRVHLTNAGFPLVGDPLYKTTASCPLPDSVPKVTGQMLHAARLHFEHPVTGETLSFKVMPPQHFLDALAALGLGFDTEIPNYF